MKLGSWLVTTAVALVLAACAQPAGLNDSSQTASSPQDWQALSEVGWTGGVTVDYAIVTLKSPPAASYAGGIKGLAPTKPERGLLDPSSPAYAAYLQHLEEEHAAYRAFLVRQLPRVSVEREFFNVLNGFAVKLNGARPGDLLRGPGARVAEYSWLYRPDMNRSVEIIGAPAVGGAAPGAGAGVKVAVIDSGIDFTHEFFACKTPAPAKVYASGVAGSGEALVFDHGTHVAGTIGGCVTDPSSGPIGPLSGVAPGAALFDYNVFPGFGAGFVAFGGSAFSHDIAAAIEEAVVDGMQVINMSLGGGVQGPHDLLAEASDAAVDAGLVVVISAGNAGASTTTGRETIGSPGSAPKAITVGASTNEHFIGVIVAVDGAEYPAAVGVFDPFADKPAVDVPLENWPGDGLACEATSEDFAGHIALIQRGACTFTTKVANAAAAGAFGVIVWNNVDGDPVAMGGDDVPGTPAVMVSKDAGETLKAQADPRLVTADGSTPVEVITPNVDWLAGFSSRGPVPFTGIIKPDLVAPGVNVYSSVFENAYAMFSGTSMSAPHVAGAAALLLAAEPGLAPGEVKSALAATAARPAILEETAVFGGFPPGAYYADTLAISRGGGRLSLPEAFAAQAYATPSNASFGFHNPAGKARTSSVTITLSGPDAEACIVAEVAGAVDAVIEGSTLTVSLQNVTGLVGDIEGEITLDCSGTTLRIPWGTYQQSTGP
jgi:minor extracellular serine protease Vpr